VKECLQRYLKNLEALYALDPELAARVDLLPLSQTPTLEPTRDGNFTVRLTADDGKPIYAHSRYEPEQEADNLVTSQIRARAREDEDQDVPDEALESLCFLIGGLGLGYHVAAVERRFRRPLLIVAEDDLALLKTALFVTDLSRPLRDRRLTFLTAADRSQLHQRLRPVLTPIMLGLYFIMPTYARRYHAGFQARITSLMRDFVEYGRLQMVSVVRNARISCQNAAFNIPFYLSQPGVEVLAGRAAGYPAIVVAAGPSLARNLGRLAELRDRAVIIAVQTVLKPLLARGLPPHFVTSLDYHEVSAQFFEGIEDFGGVTLVAESKVTWRVPEAFRGRIHLLHSQFIEDLLRDAAPPRGKLRAGSTVAHLAFYLAEHLGCQPIILVGQDLCFTDGLYYPAGTPIESTWRPELGRFTTIEMKQWERIIRSRAGLRRVKDVHGREVYTDDQMFTYAEQAQSDFLASSTRVIQAAEGGMRLEGTEVMPLAQAAERFCTRPLPPGLLAVELPRPSADLRDRACRQLRQRIEELREMRETCLETKELLERLAGLVDRPAEFNRLVLRLHELRRRVQRCDRTYNLVSQAAQLAELRRLQADRGISDDQAETSETARRRLRRDREYVSAFAEGCDFLLELLPATLARLQERWP